MSSMALAQLTEGYRLPPVPWRDPQTVSPEKLTEYIQMLEAACAEDPYSADLRTCLGMARAMNYQVYHSMDDLEHAIRLEPEHFFAQFKYAELFFRLRALQRAEAEALRALEIAHNNWEVSMARRLLQEIRTLNRAGGRHIVSTKPLTGPAGVLLVMLLVTTLVMLWR
jgi:hypothetical protein